MIRKSIIALVTTAVLAGASTGASMGTAQAHGIKIGFGHGHGHHNGHHGKFGNKRFGYDHCRVVRKKVFVGHDRFGNPVFKFRRIRVCF